MCAWVSSTQSIVAGSIGSLSQFRCFSSFEPSNKPLSTSSFLPSASIRYFEPVTVPAAPRKVILGMGRYFSRKRSDRQFFLGNFRGTVYTPARRSCACRTADLLEKVYVVAPYVLEL